MFTTVPMWTDNDSSTALLGAETDLEAADASPRRGDGLRSSAGTAALAEFTGVPDVLATELVSRPRRPAACFAKRPAQSEYTFITLQKWEGYVTQVGTETFWVRLTDLTGSAPDEEAEIALSEVSPGDRPLVADGAVFYWMIGYRDDRSGQRHRESLIRFRRLPAWTSQEMAAGARQAVQWAHELGLQ